MAFSLFNFGVGLQAQDTSRSVFEGARARVEDLREATNAYANQAARAFDNVGERVVDLGRRSIASFQKEFGAGLEEQTNKLAEFGRTLTFNMGESFNQQALGLADTTKKLAVQFGEGDDKARMLTDDIVRMSALTGQSINTFTGLANSLGKAGFDITKLSSATQSLSADGETLQTVWGEQEYLATLIDAFGVAGDEVAEFAKGSKVLGLSIKGTLDDVTQFQRNFKMPGMIEQVPEATQSAIRAISEFGTEVAGNGKQIVANTLQMGAVFAKTFGRSMRESVQEAARTMQQFNQEQINLRKIAVGLSTDFSPMVNSFLETGENLDLVRSKMRQAATDRFGPIKFAEYVRGVYERLNDAGQGLQAERFLIQMREQAPEAARNLFMIPGALAAARKEMERINKFEKQNRGLGLFQEMGNQMWDTGKVAIDVFKNLVVLSKTIVGLIFEPIAKEIFGGVANDLGTFNDRLAGLVKRINDADGAFQKRWKPALVAVGKVLVTVGTAATLAASAFATMLTAATIKGATLKGWRLLSGIFPRVGAGGAKVVGVLGGLSRVAVALGKKILLPIMAVKSLGVAFMDMARVFKDPNASGAEKFGAILRGLTVGVFDFVDDLLFGFPSKLATYFFPQLGDSLEQGMGNLFDRAWSKLGGLFSDENLDAAKVWVGNLFGRASDWLASFDITNATKNIVAGITTAIIGIGKFAVETQWNLIKGLFRGVGRWIKGWFSDEVAGPVYDESDVMWGKVANFGIEALQKIKELGLGILKGLWEGVANAAGYNVDYINGIFENMWLEAKLGVSGFQKSFLDGFDHITIEWTRFKHSFSLFVPWIKKIGGEAWEGFAFASVEAWNTAVISGAKALEKLIRYVRKGLEKIDPTDRISLKLSQAESALIDMRGSKIRDQARANKEHLKTLHAINQEYEKAAVPLNKEINAINAATAQRQKAFDAESDQINRQINQNDLLGGKAQQAYLNGLRAEKQERKAASAFRRRKAAEEKANAKSRTGGDQAAKKGRFADLWRMANLHAQDRVRNLKTSLESAGQSGSQVDKAVSEASINELKRLTTFRKAIKGGDPNAVAAGFKDFMSKTPRAKVPDTASSNFGSGVSIPQKEGMPRAGASSPGSPPARVRSAEPVAYAGPGNIVDSAGNRDRDTDDLANRLGIGGVEGRKKHEEMVDLLKRIAEGIEESTERAAKGGVRVKLEFDGDKYFKQANKRLMSSTFRDNGLGG